MSKPLSDTQIKQIHSNLKTKGKTLGKKFLAKKGIASEVSEDEMYNLIKLDNDTDPVNKAQDETDFVKSDKKLYEYLLKAKAESDLGNFNTQFSIDLNQIKD